jgi:hypothetical protein
MKLSIYSGDTHIGMSWLCRIVAIFFDLQTYNSIEYGKYSMFCCYLIIVSLNLCFLSCKLENLYS